MGIAPDSIMGVTVQTVTNQMKEIDRWAQDYNNKLTTSLGNISNIKIASVGDMPTIATPTYEPGALTLPNMPNYEPNTDMAVSDIPSAVEIVCHHFQLLMMWLYLLPHLLTRRLICQTCLACKRQPCQPK